MRPASDGVDRLEQRVTEWRQRLAEVEDRARGPEIVPVAKVRTSVNSLQGELGRWKHASVEAIEDVQDRVRNATMGVRTSVDDALERVGAASLGIRSELVRIGNEADVVLDEVEAPPGRRRPGRLQDPSAGRIQHVVPHGDGWAVKAEGASKATEVFATKEAAIERGREIGQNQKSGLVIHRSNGTIQEHHTYRGR